MIANNRVLHVESGATILDSVAVASTVFSLAVGLIGSSDGVCSLWLPQTSVIHTFGMRYPLDMIFLSAEGVVLRMCIGVPPGRLLIGPKRTRAVLETKSCDPSIFTAIRPGESIRLERSATPVNGTQSPPEPL
jgi:uncharacterized protein